MISKLAMMRAIEEEQASWKCTCGPDRDTVNVVCSRLSGRVAQMKTAGPVVGIDKAAAMAICDKFAEKLSPNGGIFLVRDDIAALSEATPPDVAGLRERVERLTADRDTALSMRDKADVNAAAFEAECNAARKEAAEHSALRSAHLDTLVAISTALGCATGHTPFLSLPGVAADLRAQLAARAPSPALREAAEALRHSFDKWCAVEDFTDEDRDALSDLAHRCHGLAAALDREPAPDAKPCPRCSYSLSHGGRKCDEHRAKGEPTPPRTNHTVMVPHPANVMAAEAIAREAATVRPLADGIRAVAAQIGIAARNTDGESWVTQLPDLRDAASAMSAEMLAAGLGRCVKPAPPRAASLHSLRVAALNVVSASSRVRAVERDRGLADDYPQTAKAIEVLRLTLAGQAGGDGEPDCGGCAEIKYTGGSWGSSHTCGGMFPGVEVIATDTNSEQLGERLYAIMSETCGLTTPWETINEESGGRFGYTLAALRFARLVQPVMPDGETLPTATNPWKLRFYAYQAERKTYRAFERAEAIIDDDDTAAAADRAMKRWMLKVDEHEKYRQACKAEVAADAMRKAGK